MEHMFMIIIRLFYAETTEAIIKFYWFTSRFFAIVVQDVLRQHKVTAATNTKPLGKRSLLSKL